jgi:hypothetical protein
MVVVKVDLNLDHILLLLGVKVAREQELANVKMQESLEDVNRNKSI